MSVLDTLLRKYNQGQLTAIHVAMEVVALVDEANVASILAAVPAEVLERIRDFVSGYQPGRMISIGGAVDPGPERVSYIRHWFDDPVAGP